MAARSFTDYQYSLVKGLVGLGANITFGSSGAPTLRQWRQPYTGGAGAYSNAPTAAGPTRYQTGEQGIYNITRVSTGVYTLLLQDPYSRLLDFHGVFSNSTGLPTIMQIGLWNSSDVTTVGTGIKFTCMSASATAADPASGDVLGLFILLQNSGAI